MAMMKENGFMPSAGAPEKDSCFFVKLRRISVRPEKTSVRKQPRIAVPELEFPYLFGTICPAVNFSGGQSLLIGVVWSSVSMILGIRDTQHQRTMSLFDGASL
jgi:hypothetical protein